MAEFIINVGDDDSPPFFIDRFRIRGEIVRCNDCQYLIEFSTSDTLILLCGRNRGALKEVWASDYCSWGEREEKVEYENADGITAWKRTECGGYECVACGDIFDKDTKYCPNCGRKMKVAKE